MKNIGRVFAIGILAVLCIVGIVVLGKTIKKESVEGVSHKEVAMMWKALTGCQWPTEDRVQEDVIWSEVQNALDDMNGNETWHMLLTDHNSEIYKGVQKMKLKYQEKDKLARDDWYGFYQLLCTFLTSKMHSDVEVINAVVLDELENGKCFTNRGAFYNETDRELERYHNYWIVTTGEDILAVWKECEEEIVVANVFIEKEDGEELDFFYHDRAIHIAYKGMAHQLKLVGRKLSEDKDASICGRVGDLSFVNGKVNRICLKEEIISGKVMQRDAEAIVLDEEENYRYEFEPDIEVYQTYAKLQTLSKDDIPIGYEYADFVLDDGKVSAVLLTRDKSMQSIRVLLKNTEEGDFFYSTFQVTADMDYSVVCDHEVERYSGGESFRIEKDNLNIGDRVLIKPAANSGKIRCMSMQRSQGNPDYRGHIEVLCTEQGLVAVNEVLLEDYLYTVVPSEMPASYPLEALKAQAICARTYGYNKMLHALYPQWGAHLDDTTTCQVYNNQAEQIETNQAVRDTFGMVAMKDDELIDTFYYSTSCGFSTTEEIWGNGKTYDYLCSGEIRPEESDQEGEARAMAMMEEQRFEDFIRLGDEADYECEEPWYRWSYHESVDKKAFFERLYQCYQQHPDKVLLWNESEQKYMPMPIPKLDTLDEIEMATRLPGGVVHEMLVVSGHYRIKIVTEQLIRTILPEPDSDIMRWDGSKISLTGILPSAFLYLNVTKDEHGEVMELDINGGGYGHGVGMSQNAAKHMAEDDMNVNEILSFFYKNIQVGKIYLNQT